MVVVSNPFGAILPAMLINGKYDKAKVTPCNGSINKTNQTLLSVKSVYNKILRIKQIKATYIKVFSLYFARR